MRNTGIHVPIVMGGLPDLTFLFQSAMTRAGYIIAAVLAAMFTP